jgi:hypothetical protein
MVTRSCPNNPLLDLFYFIPLTVGNAVHHIFNHKVNEKFNVGTNANIINSFCHHNYKLLASWVIACTHNILDSYWVASVVINPFVVIAELFEHHEKDFIYGYMFYDPLEKQHSLGTKQKHTTHMSVITCL